MSTPAAHSARTSPSSRSSTYRDLAVALTQTSADDAAMSAAVRLARAFGSRIDLLQLLLMPTPLVDSWSLVPDAAFVEAFGVIREEAKAKAVAWREFLRQAQVEGDVEPLEALYVEPSSLLAKAARCRDMVIIGGPIVGDEDAASLRRCFAALLFETGLPVLLIPQGIEPVLPPRRAVVAWADTRECVRAVHDALPLLQGCEAVSVASVKDSHVSDPMPLVALLKQHGVAAESASLRLVGDESTASRIMHHASASRAQLIVAGGYGHSRLREWAVGGVTRELLTYARVPVLFSH